MSSHDDGTIFLRMCMAVLVRGPSQISVFRTQLEQFKDTCGLRQFWGPSFRILAVCGRQVGHLFRGHAHITRGGGV